MAMILCVALMEVEKKKKFGGRQVRAQLARASAASAPPRAEQLSPSSLTLRPGFTPSMNLIRICIARTKCKILTEVKNVTSFVPCLPSLALT